MKFKFYTKMFLGTALAFLCFGNAFASRLIKEIVKEGLESSTARRLVHNGIMRTPGFKPSKPVDLSGEPLVPVQLPTRVEWLDKTGEVYRPIYPQKQNFAHKQEQVEAPEIKREGHTVIVDLKKK